MQAPFASPLQPIPSVEQVRDSVLSLEGDLSELIGHGYGHVVGGIRAATAQLGLILDEPVREVTRKVGSLKAAYNRLVKKAASEAPREEPKVEEAVPVPPVPETQPVSLPGFPCACAFPVGFEIPPECQGKLGTIVSCDPVTGQFRSCRAWNEGEPPLRPGECLINSEDCRRLGLCPPLPPAPPPGGPPAPPAPPPKPPPPPPPKKCCDERCPPPRVYVNSWCELPDRICVSLAPDPTVTTFGCCQAVVNHECNFYPPDYVPPQCPPETPPAACVYPLNCDRVNFHARVPLASDWTGTREAVYSECGQYLLRRSEYTWMPVQDYIAAGDPLSTLAISLALHRGKGYEPNIEMDEYTFARLYSGL